MKNSKAGIKEYELEAYFDFICKSNGVKDLAFKTIAASGKNATVLHYVTNDSELKDGDLILFDLGAQYKYYNGDININKEYKKSLEVKALLFSGRQVS